MTSSKKVRESGIELLRIMLMLQVIFLHVCTKGHYSEFARGHLGPRHELFYWFIWLMCRCPVYLFILISGYFSVTSNKSLGAIQKKTVNTYLTMLFYSISIPVIGWIFGLWNLSTANIIRMFTPFASRAWYFMTLYLIVLFLSPFLNACLINLSKKDYTILVIFCSVIFSILPMATRIKPFSEVVNLEQVVTSEGGKGLYGFLYMYILGGYLRLHVKSYDKAKIRYLLMFLLINIINVFLRYSVPVYRTTVGTNDNILIILEGVCLVLYFRDLKFHSQVINRIASYTLGVYMIHEHLLLRKVIWNQIFAVTQTKAFYTTYKYPIKIFLICIAIFAGCSLIEQVRVWIFETFCCLARKKQSLLK